MIMMTTRSTIRSMTAVIVVMMMVRGVRLVRYLCNDKRVSSTVRFDDEEWQLISLKENDCDDDDGVTKMVRTTIKSIDEG